MMHKYWLVWMLEAAGQIQWLYRAHLHERIIYLYPGYLHMKRAKYSGFSRNIHGHKKTTRRQRYENTGK